MDKIQKTIRHSGLWLLPLLVLAWLYYTDPDKGASTHDMLLGMATATLAVTFSYVGAKIALSYIKLEEWVGLARGGNVAAGLVVLARVLFQIALLFVFAPRAHAQDATSYIPAGAVTYAPMLKAEQARLWPQHPQPASLAALVELESGPNITRSWNPAARLKTSREEGASFGQITRAYNADGTVRFDALAATRALDPSLAEWSWGNVYRRPDLALRGIVVTARDCDRHLAPLVHDAVTRVAMCDAAYNGGYGGMQSERRACGMRSWCDPQQWFRHVELVCLKSHVAMAGYGRSPCQINRQHVEQVAVVRWPKYVPLMRGT